MFTPLFYKLFEIQCRISSFLGVFSLQFDATKRKCYITSKSRVKSRKLLIYWINTTVFCSFQTISTSLEDGNSSNRNFRMCFAISQLTLMILLTLGVFNMKEDLLARAISQTLLHAEKFKSEPRAFIMQ